MSAHDVPLAGRRAVVTGASSGIGLATVRRLVALGADVTGVARRAEAITVDGDDDGRLHPLPLDVTDAAAVAAAGLAEAGPLDLLVCAAGTNVPNRRLGELDTETWSTLVDTNLTGCFTVVSACLPALRAARGLVILVGSVSGIWPDVSGPGYQAAKAGLLGFARGAGVEELEHGVRFSVVEPGLVDTPLLDRRPQPPSAEDRARALRPDDVAQLIAFLATLPERVNVPEVSVLPSALQVAGRTW